MVDFVNMFVNYIAGIYTTVFGGTVLDFGSFSVTLGELLCAGIVTILAINLFWRGAKY